MTDGIQNGRNPDGTFATGNKPEHKSPGRPPDSNKKEYLQIMRDTLTPEKWKEILEMAIMDATDPKDAFSRNNAREFFAKRVLPNKVELEFTGEIPVQIIAVEGFAGWKNAESES